MSKMLCALLRAKYAIACCKKIYHCKLFQLIESIALNVSTEHQKCEVAMSYDESKQARVGHDNAAKEPCDSLSSSFIGNHEHAAMLILMLLHM